MDHDQLVIDAAAAELQSEEERLSTRGADLPNMAGAERSACLDRLDVLEDVARYAEELAS